MHCTESEAKDMIRTEVAAVCGARGAVHFKPDNGQVRALLEFGNARRVVYFIPNSRARNALEEIRGEVRHALREMGALDPNSRVGVVGQKMVEAVRRVAPPPTDQPSVDFGALAPPIPPRKLREEPKKIRKLEAQVAALTKRLDEVEVITNQLK